MATKTLQVNFHEHFKSELVASDEVNEEIQLTPYLSLACALLYMASSDGEFGVHESSHLQSVLGGDQEVLRYGVHFVQTVSFDGFLVDAPELLSTKDKWCILANVCDALLSDGHADQAELAIFARLRQAFGVSEKQFEPYFKVLTLKNDKSKLGKYTGVREDRQPMTPHLALACALLYMLTSDGAIGVQEIGQLESVIGEFEGLQKVALSYVRTVKMNAFLDEASVVLNAAQKLYLLTNVCDSMLADGEVANIEDKLFLSMLHSFGYNEASFAHFYQVLEVKNVKPFDTSEFKNRVQHERKAGHDDEEGVTFSHALSKTSLAGGEAQARENFKQGSWQVGVAELEMSQFISRQMQDNKQTVSEDFNGQDDIELVEKNVRDSLNLQQIDDSLTDTNRQLIASASSLANKQQIDSDVTKPNLQVVDVDGSKENREVLSLDVRSQNIQEGVDEVNQRLDHFESVNYRFLLVGRSQKFTDDFVLIEADASSVNDQSSVLTVSTLGIASMTTGMDEASLVASVAVPSVCHINAERVDQAASPRRSLLSLANLVVRAPKIWTAHGLLNGGAKLMTFCFSMPHKQIALALATMVFASPIYTRPAQGRVFTGPLVMMIQIESEAVHLTFDVDRTETLQVR